MSALSGSSASRAASAALGVYRFWRDSGHAVGALIGGITATLASLVTAVAVAAVLTAISGLLAWAFMAETHPRALTEVVPTRNTGSFPSP